MKNVKIVKKTKDTDLYIEFKLFNEDKDIEEKSTILLTSDEFISYLRLTKEIKDGDRTHTKLSNYLLTDSITGVYTELDENNRNIFGVSTHNVKGLKNDLYEKTLNLEDLFNCIDVLLSNNHFVKLYENYISSTYFSDIDASNMYLYGEGESIYTEFNKKLTLEDLQFLLENYSSNIRTSLLPDIKNNFNSDVLNTINKQFVKSSEN